MSGTRVSRLSSTDTSLSRQLAGLRQDDTELSREQSKLSQAEGTRANAITADLGVCVYTTTEDLDNYTPVVQVITSVSVYSPSLTDGVASCPSGSFVPVAPQAP